MSPATYFVEPSACCCGPATARPDGPVAVSWKGPFVPNSLVLVLLLLWLLGLVTATTLGGLIHLLLLVVVVALLLRLVGDPRTS